MIDWSWLCRWSLLRDCNLLGGIMLFWQICRDQIVPSVVESEGQYGVIVQVFPLRWNGTTKVGAVLPCTLLVQGTLVDSIERMNDVCRMRTAQSTKSQVHKKSARTRPQVVLLLQYMIRT